MEWNRLFSQRMEQLLGDGAPDFFRAADTPPARAFRYDPEKVSAEILARDFGRDLGQALPFGANALRFHGEGIGAHPLHHGGALYMQEPSAMAPVAALDGMHFDRILDLCAAPGGKSLQAAASLLSPDGVIVCNEPDGKRRRALMQNIERMGERRCQVTGFDGREVPAEWNGSFDLVICDAPCSGEGMIRKSPEIAENWTQEGVLSCARRQKELILRAADLVCSGGVLLYSTCAWSVEENEEVAAYLLGERGEFSLLPPSPAVRGVSAEGVFLSPQGPDPKKLCRFYPHLFDGEGQFLALFQKEGEKNPFREKKKKEKASLRPKKGAAPDPLEVGRLFLKETLTEMPKEDLILRGEMLYLVPCGGVDAAMTVSPGVCIGEVRGGRVIPHHRFFQAYHRLFRRRVVLSSTDARVEAYLRGEEIPLEGEKGYGVLSRESCPLGGVRLGGGRGKNCYPKGLRKSDV